MNFKEYYLKERFFKGYKGDSSYAKKPYYIETFINPNPSEVKNLYKSNVFKSIRVGFDKKANLYAWDGSAELHDFVSSNIKVDFVFAATIDKNDISVWEEWDSKFIKQNETIQNKIITNLKKTFPNAKFKSVPNAKYYSF